MRFHTSRTHSMPIKTYKEKYGNHRQQMVKEVYHKCGVCRKDMLLDSDDIKNHLYRHGLSQKLYNSKFLAENKPLEKEEKTDDVETEPISILDTLDEIENIIDAL